MELTVIALLGLLLAIAAVVPAFAIQSYLTRRLKEEHSAHSSAIQQLESVAGDAMFSIDEAGAIISFNPIAEKLFEFPAKEIIGQSIALLIPAAAGGSATNYGLNAISAAPKTPNGIGIQVTGQRKNGTYIPLDLRLSEAMDQGRRLFHAVARDLTDRQTSERHAREVQFLDGLLQSVGAPVLILDRDGRVYRTNHAFDELTGHLDAKDRYYWELLLPTAEWQRAKNMVSDIVSTNSKERGEHIWRKSSGETLPLYLAMTALRAGNATAEHVVIAAFPVPERAPVDTHAVTMEAVERLAGGIAKQFNELLTSINGYSDLVLHTVEEQNPIRRDVEEIKKAGERAAALTSQLLAFSQKQPMRSSVFDLNKLIHSMKDMLQILLGDRIAVSTVLDLELGQLKADAGWIEQVILNLAVNARDAMPEGGRFTIETSNTAMDFTEARRTAQLPPGDYILLTVTDTGCGMDATIHQHLFEPFYTTKRSGKGMGLGLSTVYGVVRQSGGNVVVQSIPGSGTSVRIYMPRCTEEIQPDKAAKGLYLVRGAGA